jgi:hypothetical protein
MKQAALDLLSILIDKNSEIFREFFEFDPEISELCPKSANLIFGTGN